ncbi:MAG: 4a-hydroxytetrahydrobiopterin dehydratase [Gammaproteobacteria bacterium]|nr:4a-hydroxytetrahydrobiopterin dehydratase [Gammaproteobacteria bacterium]
MAKADPNATKLTNAELEALGSTLFDWAVDASGETPRLVRKFLFANFADALAFTNRVGDAAEAANHHPLISLTWGEAVVEWWSHSAGGVTRNDIQMARTTDTLYSST